MERAGAHAVVLHVRHDRTSRSTSNNPSPVLLRLCGRHDDVAVCIFCDPDEPGPFPSDDDSFCARKAGVRCDSRGAPSARTSEPLAVDD